MGLNLEFEKNLILSDNYDCIVGIDEVGRGSWAGPVAVGGYLFKLDTEEFEGVNDSKLVKKDKRSSLYSFLKNHSHYVVFKEVEEIDSVGIGRTIQNAILEIIDKVTLEYSNPFFIVDGQFSIDFGRNVIKKNKADSTFYSVAAASILAKVERDSLMLELHKSYPEYFFNSNVGYPTRKHLDSLSKFGPSPIHRKSFKPIRDLSLRFIR